MIIDFKFVFYWWLILLGIGVVFFPLTRYFFQKFFDRGYALSKIVGILLVSYVVWLLGSLKILPFLTETVWLVILAAAAANCFLIQNSKFKIKSYSLKLKSIIRENWKIFLFEEAIFFVCLAFWSFVRGFQPDIHGLEKFMDFGFVNSILRSRWFPPADMWLAGETINYYYFGHLVSAVLTKLSGIDSVITYNLMIATIFALSFTAAFSLGGNLIFLSTRNSQPVIRKLKNLKLIIFAGLLTASLLSLGGNLHPLWWFLKHGNFRNYWYPDATRFIVQLFGAADNTIHEFPIYSFVVADLHGHFLNLPNVLLFFALILIIFSSKKISLLLCCFVALLLAIFYMTNAWDFAIYHLVFGLSILLFNCLKYKISLKTILQTAKIVIPILIGSLIFSFPFHLNFKNLTSGVALTDFHSPPWMLLILWGFPLFITLAFITHLTIKRITNYELRITDTFVLVLLAISWFLIIFPEFFYLKDIYIHSYQRANTMFKLTYQSFVMFALVGGYVIVNILSILKREILKFFYVIFNFSFLIFIFVYPYFAIRSYYGLKTYRGIYGLSYLKQSYPNDYQAILWLKKNVSGQPVIIEAVGESYTDFARVSANTGLPTILGWRVHEWLWRGSFDEAGKRTGEIQEIYESTDIANTKALLNKYLVKYIFVGDLEKKQYSRLSEEKFNQLGEVVFFSGGTKIYKLEIRN